MVGCRVLLVDDHREMDRAFARLLREHEFHVHAVYDIESARATLRHDPYDVILVELRTPSCGRAAACRQFRDDGFRGGIAVFTEYANKEDELRALRAGADVFIEKTVDAEILAERLRSLDRRASRSRSSRPSGEEWAIERNEISFTLLPCVFADGKRLDLTPIEARIFGRLYQEIGRAVSTGELCAFAWPNQKVTAHAVHTHVSQLRRKVEEAGWKIANLRGYGYRLTGVGQDVPNACARAGQGSTIAKIDCG